MANASAERTEFDDWRAWWRHTSPDYRLWIPSRSVRWKSKYGWYAAKQALRRARSAVRYRADRLILWLRGNPRPATQIHLSNAASVSVAIDPSLPPAFAARALEAAVRIELRRYCWESEHPEQERDAIWDEYVRRVRSELLGLYDSSTRA